MEQTRAAEFVEENLKTIFGYALSRVSNKDDAEDLTNDIVLAILQSADRIKNDAAFYGYIWAIAANTCRKYSRMRARDLFIEIDETISDDFDFTETVSAQADAGVLRREIAMLSKAYRECTIAYYYNGLSCTEISKRLGISPEMVKYYLYKTRKILKEGISMEREFSERSFKPTPFTFVTIFSGKNNLEYHNLFSRKLPGQILLSAYYTPMTTRELALELGVATVYLEDEIALLENYGFLTKTTAGKVQTNLVIFTGDFTREFYADAVKIVEAQLPEILSGVREKLDAILEVNAVCKALQKDRLLWNLLWPVMRQGNGKFEKEHLVLQEKVPLYDGAAGTNYGISDEDSDPTLTCEAFAGYAEIDEDYYACAADFGVLPAKNHYFANVEREALRETITKMVSGEAAPEFMILSAAEEACVFEILSAETDKMAKLYEQLFVCACRLMRIHAPKSVGTQIEHIVFQTLFFRTVGLIGRCAVSSGAFTIPEFDGPAAIYIRENDKTNRIISQSVL